MMIFKAIYNNDRVEFLMLDGAHITDLNFTLTHDGVGLLLYAAARGQNDMISLMTKNKEMDLNKTDKQGINAFWIAAFYSHIDTMRLLHRSYIDIKSVNQNGSNALHISVKGNLQLVVKELIQMKFPLDDEKKNGVTAAGIAAYKGYLHLLQFLDQAGADLLKTGKNTGIGLMYLAIKSN